MIKKKIDKKTDEQLDLLPNSPKVKRKKKKPESKKSIVILFLITILFSLAFFLFGKAPSFLEDANIKEQKEVGNSSNSQGVVSEVAGLTKDLQGDYGFYVYSLASGKAYGLNSKKEFKSDLFEKLALMIACFKQEEKGNLDLKTVYILTDEEKKKDSGVIWAKPAGTHFTYLNLLKMIGQYSDSTAIDVLEKRVGEKAIEETIEELGVKEIDLKEKTITPTEIGILFRKIYTNEALSEKSAKDFFAFLTETAFEKKIPRLLPKEVKVSHLESTEENSFADAGIVFGENPFVIVILASEAEESEAREVFPQIAKIIWEFENK
ncbi:MAG: serine hydrolase [Patescibacteria group bacterium]